jgi:magnesium-transporting ATPase (P-type)
MEEKIVVRRPQKSPALAVILAVIAPGTGAMYNRQILKGLIYMIIIAGLISTLTVNPPIFVILLSSLLLFGFYIYQIFEAAQTANAINRKALAGEEEEAVEVEEFPEAVKAGSIFWGIILILLGAFLLLANFEVISYSTAWQFWPVVVIIIGIKLIADFVSKKQEENRGG